MDPHRHRTDPYVAQTGSGKCKILNIHLILLFFFSLRKLNFQIYHFLGNLVAGMDNDFV